MFDFVRKHTKIMMFLMFLLIIPAFVLVGVDGFRRINGSGKTVATVGSFSITESDWDAAHKQQVDRVRASRPELDPKLLDSDQARYTTLEEMVRERVIADAVNDMHLTTTDTRLARELQQNPTIASLRKPDGTLDMEKYSQLASSQGLTPEGFESRIRASLTQRQIQSGVTDSSFSSASVTDAALNAFYERRDVQIASFKPADYSAKVSPSDADIESWYQANQPRFQAPETASIEYIVLDLDSVKKGLVPNATEVKAYYDQNVARLSGQEERRASHILITANKDAPAADKAKAKQKATELLAQVRKSPDTFAEVARKNSQDPGSAAKGGDLDWVARGAMVKPFENAVFSMKKGEISDVVESDFGYHIILLTDIKAPKQKSFEELRPGIEADLLNQMAQRKFAEAAESFTNGVYEQADSYKAVAEKLKLEVKTAGNLHRNPAPGATGPMASQKFLDALFTNDSVDKKRNTEAVEIAPNQLASGRITQFSPAHTMPLTEVKSQVREQLIASRAAELAKKDGAEKLSQWKSNAGAANLPAPVTVSRQGSQNLPRQVVDAALRADASNLPAWTGVDLGAQGYAVVRINKVMPRTTPDANMAKQERAQFGGLIARAENEAWYKLLENRFKANIKVDKPAKLGTSPAEAQP